MSKMKNWMMDIEEFCDEYAFMYPSDEYALGEQLDVDQIVLAADNMFRSTEAGNYARTYIETQLGEI